MRTLLLTLPLAVFAMAACGDDEPKTEETDTLETGDTGETPEPSVCETLGLSEVPFDTAGPFGEHRRDLVEDFELPLSDGTTWRLSENWSGCDVVLFANSRITNGGESYWNEGLDDLLETSPRNAIYVFVPIRETSTTKAEEMALEMQDRIDQHLATLDEEERAWWQSRLLAVPKTSFKLDGAIGDILSSGLATYGLAVDRFQRLRPIGYPNDPRVDRSSLVTLAWEAEFFNFEAVRQARLDAIDATVVEGLGGDVIEQYHDFELTLPGDVSQFDTLEVDVIMECQDPDVDEVGEWVDGELVHNCGEWDYLAYLWLFEGEGEDQVMQEMARFITTYARESRWVVDASHALPWLAEAGTRTMRYEWAPPWNTQPTAVTLRLRFSNEGKEAAPAQLIPLWEGGSFNADYNTNHPAIEVDIPASAKKVELVAITTGHGGADGNCAEFCDHSHEFTVGGEEFLQEFPEVNDTMGCAKTISTGTPPNQYGTWWYGRGGWCPGRRVDPWVVNVTDQVTAGGTESVSYRGLYNGREITNPEDDRGNIKLSTWLLISE